MEFLLRDTSVRVNIPDRATLADAIEARLADGAGFALATLNLDHLVKLRESAAFREAYARHDFVTADGNPIVWLARAAGHEVKLLPGSDLIHPILRIAASRGIPVAFLGSTEATLRAAADSLSRAIPRLEVRACIAPPMNFDPASPEALSMLGDLQAQGVGLVLLALGAPKQERLAALGRIHHPSLGFVSIGAGLDFIAGSQRRAPAWIRYLALEWLWRMALSPRRLFMRYARCALILPGFLLNALIHRSLRSGQRRAAAGRTSN